MEKLFGLIGEKLGHTYSPIIHKKILEQIGMEGHYGLFEVKREYIDNVVVGLKALGYKGVNVTIPYKRDIMKNLDDLSPEARNIGAINVIDIDDEGRAIGYNTDYYGFGMMLKDAKIDIKGENAVILGTGGTSKAVIEYLKNQGIKDMVMVTRDKDASRFKNYDLKIVDYNDLKNIRNYSIIINTTPVGMYPNMDNSPVDRSTLSKFSYAVDLIYNPISTVFLKEAEDEGLKTANGLYMLIAQAVKSQKIWNDIEIPESIIENIMTYFNEEIL